MAIVDNIPAFYKMLRVSNNESSRPGLENWKRPNAHPANPVRPPPSSATK